MTRTVFYGFGAYVGAITGPTTCSWWPDDPTNLQWDPTKQISVDLGLNPQAVLAGRVTAAAVQVDDFAGWGTGGLTKIGPLFPFGQLVGACWLESTFWNNLGANKPARIPSGMMCHDYELTAVLDWTAKRRFYGTYAEIQSTQGTLALVSIWNPGLSMIPNQPPIGTWWLDLAQVADPISGGFTTIGTGAADPTKGALFLDQTAIQQIQPASPKLPPNRGESHYLEPADH